MLVGLRRSLASSCDVHLERAGPRHLCVTVRPGLPCRAHGRAAGATGQGNAPSDCRHAAAAAPRRLRIRTGGHGLGFPVQRAAGGVAAGDGPGPPYEGGLGGGGRRPVGRTLRRLPEGHPWCATTSTRTPRAPSTKCSTRPGHGNWFVASRSATITTRLRTGRVEGRRVTGRVRWLIRRFPRRAAVRDP